MSDQLCTRCGRPLRNGACPAGHPQRAVQRRRTRSWRGPLIFLLVVLLLAGGAYAGFIWYPPKAAQDAVGGPSERFAEATPPFREAVDLYPDGGTEEDLGRASAVLAATDAARSRLTALQTQLEEASVVAIPVVSDRPVLQLADRVLTRMETFTTSALILMADLEVTARYLTELGTLLPTLDNLRAAVGNPRAPGDVEGSVAAATPIAEQLIADLQTLSPPEELSPSHAAMLAIARGVRTTIDDLAGAGETGQAATPVIRAFVEDLRAQLEAFREAAVAAPADAIAAGFGDRIEEAESRIEAIVVDLRDLQAEGVEGITVPEA